MPDKPPKHGHHNPSQRSLQRWDNEGGATTRAKRPRDFSQAAKLVIDIATGQVADRPPTPEEQGKDAAAVERGRRGGKVRAERMTPEERKASAQAAVKASRSRR